MTNILAIDPGPEKSAFIVWDGAHVLDRGIIENRALIDIFGKLVSQHHCYMLGIEMIASYGMAVGAEVFETCVWIGRFLEAWAGRCGSSVRIPRLAVKVNLCKSAKAKDANIRQALIDRFGAVGTKKTPGPLFGVSSHCWAALAVAVTAADELSRNRKSGDNSL